MFDLSAGTLDIVMEMIPSIVVNLTKIDERQMTLMTSIDASLMTFNEVVDVF